MMVGRIDTVNQGSVNGIAFNLADKSVYKYEVNRLCSRLFGCFTVAVICSAVIGGFGNTVNDLLYKGTKEEIQAEAKKLIAEAGRTGVILGADCTVPRDISLDRLEWVREAAE